MMPGILNFHLPKTSPCLIIWMPLSTENEVRIGGINSENVNEDVRLGQVSDEDIGFDTGERVGTFLILEPPTQR